MKNPFAKSAPAIQTFTLAEFLSKAKSFPEFLPHERKFGRAVTEMYVMAIYDLFLRRMTGGVWNPLGNFTFATPPAEKLLKVRSGDVSSFSGLDFFLAEMLRQDVSRTLLREKHVGDLKADAKSGKLWIDLQSNEAPEASYYVPPSQSSSPGVPPKNPPPRSLINLNKAIGWAAGDPTNQYGMRAIVADIFRLHSSPHGDFPIKSMALVDAIWRRLVVKPDPYRLVNIMADASTYGSSFAGTEIVRAMLLDLKGQTLPAKGATGWYDWALYVFGTMMAAQGFPDGNKRISRCVYGLILVHGGVDFRAPNNRWGSQIGMMGKAADADPTA